MGTFEWKREYILNEKRVKFERNISMYRFFVLISMITVVSNQIRLSETLQYLQTEDKLMQSVIAAKIMFNK